MASTSTAVRRLWLLGALSISLLLSSCGEQKQQMNGNWNGGLITKQGTYQLATTKQAVTVWIDKEGLVRYSITDASGKQLIATTERASAYSKWFLFYDRNAWLWFESSDIGCSVAKRSEDGSYKELPIVDEVSLIRAMPDEFFKRLPDSTQKKWSTHRK